jgi:TFIIF-interacting CTD phosphatase-like protein
LPILSWYEDMKDRALFDLIPLLIELSKIDDVREAIPRFVKNNLVDFNIAIKIC